MVSDQTSEAPPQSQTEGPEPPLTIVDKLAQNISKASFDTWYKEKVYQENILEGQSYFNKPKQPKDPDYHTPSSLLKCHRKSSYSQFAAPKETHDPTGIFWVGTAIEEELILPYLQSLVDGTDTYVTNSMWIDIKTESTDRSLEIRGATDPVLVDELGQPILPTEIKSRKSIKNLSEPSEPHLAQTHAYMEGLSQKYDREIRSAIIIYVSRNSLEVRPFYIDFDKGFWNNTVLKWAENQTEYRIGKNLPPDSPMYDWECGYCAFQERCGKGDREYADIPPDGFLPLFKYPREKTTDYVKAHSDAKLTPALAHEYPRLTDEFPVYDWVCPACSTSFDWQEIEWDGNMSSSPLCPTCAESGELNSLKAPTLTENNGEWTVANQGKPASDSTLEEGVSNEK